MLPKAPHLLLLISLCREKARLLDLSMEPHLVGMTAGLNSIFWQTCRDGSRDYCFVFNSLQSSVYNPAELEIPTQKMFHIFGVTRLLKLN